MVGTLRTETLTLVCAVVVASSGCGGQSQSGYAASPAPRPASYDGLFSGPQPWTTDVSGAEESDRSDAIVQALSSMGGWGGDNALQIDFSIPVFSPTATRRAATWSAPTTTAGAERHATAFPPRCRFRWTPTSKGHRISRVTPQATAWGRVTVICSSPTATAGGSTRPIKPLQKVKPSRRKAFSYGISIRSIRRPYAATSARALTPPASRSPLSPRPPTKLPLAQSLMRFDSYSRTTESRNPSTSDQPPMPVVRQVPIQTHLPTACGFG